MRVVYSGVFDGVAVVVKLVPLIFVLTRATRRRNLDDQEPSQPSRMPTELQMYLTQCFGNGRWVFPAS